MEWSKYNIIYKSNKHGELLFNTLSGAFIDLNNEDSKSLIYSLKEGDIEELLKNDDETKNYLLSSAIISKEGDESNFNFLKMKALMNRYSRTHRVLTILPTVDCNLNCSYCFVGDNISNNKMSSSVIVQLKNYIKDNYSDVEHLSLCWFGGEPLLEINIIEDITKYINELGINYEADIVTNGILLNRQLINKLIELNINNFQITLDGVKLTHDSKRRYRDGGGTYDLIIDNLKILHESINNKDIVVNIRVNVDLENQDEYHEVHAFISNSFPKFRIYPGIITKYQSCSSAINCFSNKKEIAKFLIQQYDKHGIKDLSFYPIIRGTNSCTADNPYCEVIGPNGEIYICLKDVGDKNEIIGNIYTGITNINILTDYTVKYFAFDDNQCKKCRVLALCGGGCANLRYRNDKYGEDHDFCAQFKDFNILKKYLDIHYEIIKTNA